MYLFLPLITNDFEQLSKKIIAPVDFRTIRDIYTFVWVSVRE